MHAALNIAEGSDRAHERLQAIEKVQELMGQMEPILSRRRTPRQRSRDEEILGRPVDDRNPQ